MSTGRVRGGLCYFKINGQQYDLRADVKYSTGDIQRESVAGLDGIHGYTETKVAPYIEGTFSDAGDLDTKTFQTITDATITLECGNGKQVILRNAWNLNPIEVDAQAGSFSARFEAPAAEEVTISG